VSLDFLSVNNLACVLERTIRFFGAGNTDAIVAKLIFDSPPAMYLLFKVESPFAAKTIMAGINQTILLSLIVVVDTSLIGAKGLGEDLLESVKYVSEGQGVLGGIAILCCALIIGQILQCRKPE
jgi:glycine betaine/proline transport system permease protein